MNSYLSGQISPSLPSQNLRQYKHVHSDRKKYLKSIVHGFLYIADFFFKPDIGISHKMVEFLSINSFQRLNGCQMNRNVC